MLFLIQATKTVSAGGWTANNQAPTFFVDALDEDNARHKAKRIMGDSRPGAEISVSVIVAPVLPETFDAWSKSCT